MSKGGRPATGSIRWQFNPDPEVRKHQWYGRVTEADGSRPFKPLDPEIPFEDRATALACAVETAAWFKENPVVGDAVRETVGEWFVRFHAHKEKMALPPNLWA